MKIKNEKCKPVSKKALKRMKKSRKTYRSQSSGNGLAKWKKK